MKNDRVVEILKRVNEERCNSISEEMSCGDSIEQCKRCTMRALGITEEEYNELFSE